MFPNIDVQPSFCLTAVRNDEYNVNGHIRNNLLEELNVLNSNLYMQITNWTVHSKHLKRGYSSPAFIDHSNDIFFLGSTIPPSNHHPDAPEYLEHPYSGFDYFRSVGIGKVVAENKYMGSRGHIFAFREGADIPSGYQSIQIVSRSGAPFFKTTDIPMLWLKELSVVLDNIGLDFIVLDGEILPWSFKAQNLIKKDFEVPGYCALSSTEECYGIDSEEYKNAQSFLETLSWYSSDEDPYFRAFDILSAGTTENGYLKETHRSQYTTFDIKYDILAKLETEHIKPVESRIIDLQSPEQCEDAVNDWSQYCQSGGEGWILKPYPLVQTFSQNGTLILPAMKIRGREYLRIVYGKDYLKPECLEFIKTRRLGKKNKFSKMQYEISNNILSSRINDISLQKIKFLGAFCGFQMHTLNATL
eukprot:TRINITY_DN5724_c0_g2_i2.p1 TRINITY_DN5724_c0_g2~~TRINITY_DN5724_c0_g2_i2.p1  ORF type:complete len:416 (+),score=87.72 TRINITY_DN5724_c0_g2_i2:222-1469(+)